MDVLFLHSVLFRFDCERSKLTIFNSFNFKKVDATRPKNLPRIFCEYSELSNRLYFSCLQACRDLPDKKTAFFAWKTPSFSQWCLFCLPKSVILVENKPKTRKNSAEILFLYSCFLIKEIVMYVFLFCQFDNSTGK